MFGRDPIVPLSSFFEPMVRYLGKDENILSLETLKAYTNGCKQFGASQKGT